MYFRVMASLCIVGALIACDATPGTNSETGNEDEDYRVRFSLLPPEESGIDFQNTFEETYECNYLIYDGSYQGAGVGVGDIDNDGLPDLYFAGNQVPDRLYRNLGDFKFEDITEKAGIARHDGWSTAVAFGDVNNDGWQDIYVGLFLWQDINRRLNKLYVNNGDGTFTEKSREYGVADAGFAMGACFFDYDKDGFLDLYVVNQPPNHLALRDQFKNVRDYRYSGRLYHNENGERFTDVTGPSGTINFGYGLGAIANDINNDGWTDLYLAFDYDEPDLLFYNNGDGTFTNVANEALAHISNFSMGVDVADINNDGWMDIFVADMVAPDNERLKTQMSGMNPDKFWALANNGYHHQYMFNCLQVNNGNGRFSEIGQLAGVGNTDWSWASLFLDVNLDGYNDLFVTNGIKRDVRDNDFRLRRKARFAELILNGKVDTQGRPMIDPFELLDMAPVTRLSNYMFDNNGDLTFTNRASEWGLHQQGWTHGASYADLDLDGDLDLIVNNMNQPAGLYRNDSHGDAHYLIVKPVNGGEHRVYLNTKVIVQSGVGEQYREVTATRGYLSNSEPIAHFGLAGHRTVDKLTIIWPDNTQTVLTDVPADQTLVVDRNEVPTSPWKPEPEPATLFRNVELPVFTHQENVHDDYADEILLPHKMSTLGPCMAVADVNADGFDDVFVGGARGQAGQLLVQNREGAFSPVSGPWQYDEDSEDISALFFDANGDGQVDLYVASGGNEAPVGHTSYADRLYLNDGNGNFTRSRGIPEINVSTGALAAGDYDRDGDIDIFVGGRQWPKKWPFPVNSTLLVNDGQGNFDPLSDELFTDYGMVTDAQFANLDDDDHLELITVGEWMPIKVLDWQGSEWRDISESYGLTGTEGWWNCIEVADLDADGDMDLVVGNLGQNIKYKASAEEPFKVYSGDFDENGSNDIYLGYYQHGKLFPVRGRQCSSDQMPFIKEKFKTYGAFANATLEEVLGPSIEGALILEAKTFETACFINDGEGNFAHRPLPNWAQFSTVQDVLLNDFDKDGDLDLLVAGNYYNREVETRRSDGSVGLLLKNDGTANFTPVHPAESGFNAWRDARALALVNGSDVQYVLVANNNGPVQVFAVNGSGVEM